METESVWWIMSVASGDMLSFAGNNADYYDSQNPLHVLAAIVIAVYSFMEWFTFDAFLPLLVWLWNVTPAHWPFWAKFLIYPGISAVLALLLRAWRNRLRIRNLFGSARFATRRDLARAGMFAAGGRYLGKAARRDVFIHGEGHTLTIAAQGGGKTTGLVIPTLLEYPGTIIVTDPKAAIVAQTERDRATRGGVVKLSPWHAKLAADPAFGLDTGDDGFNPLQIVGADAEGRAGAALLAGLILPDLPGQETYWRQEGRELLEWGMLWQAAFLPAEQRTLPRLRQMLYNLPELVELMKLHATGSHTGAAMESLREGAGKFYGLAAMGAGAQLSGVVGTATSGLKIYNEGTPLGAHVSRDGFRLADLKSGSIKTLYLICPPDHLVGDDRNYLNLTISLICQQIGKPGMAVETVLLVDEFPALGYLPNLVGSLEQFREAGLRAHLIAQNPGQILTIYGADGLRRLWGACENKQFFRITDYEQARLVSDWAGQRTEVQHTRNAQGGYSASHVGVPLVRPEELTGMAAEKQIILRPGMPAIRGTVFPFYKREDWNARVDRNPYRRGKD